MAAMLYTFERKTDRQSEGERRKGQIEWDRKREIERKWVLNSYQSREDGEKRDWQICWHKELEFDHKAYSAFYNRHQTKSVISSKELFLIHDLTSPSTDLFTDLSVTCIHGSKPAGTIHVSLSRLRLIALRWPSQFMRHRTWITNQQQQQTTGQLMDENICSWTHFH